MVQAVEPLAGILTGCDPELFLYNLDKGHHVSAHDLLPGTKAEPFKVPGGAIQVDGMAAEFNIDPAPDYKTFSSNIMKVLQAMKKMLPDNISFDISPAIEFPRAVFDAAPPEAKELGCTPDFNAWTGEINPPPAPPSETPTLRTASGHIHIGWTDGAASDDITHINHCQDLVKQLDWFLGAWSLSKDTDSRRRVLYGKAGACRYKPYGVEYRVLSNFWLSGSYRLEVWNRLHTAIHQMRTSFYPESAGPEYTQALITAISTSKRNTSLESMYQFPIRMI